MWPWPWTSRVSYLFCTVSVHPMRSRLSFFPRLTPLWHNLTHHWKRTQLKCFQVVSLQILLCDCWFKKGKHFKAYWEETCIYIVPYMSSFPRCISLEILLPLADVFSMLQVEGGILNWEYRKLSKESFQKPSISRGEVWKPGSHACEMGEAAGERRTGI